MRLKIIIRPFNQDVCWPELELDGFIYPFRFIDSSDDFDETRKNLATFGDKNIAVKYIQSINKK